VHNICIHHHSMLRFIQLARANLNNYKSLSTKGNKNSKGVKHNG